MSIYDVLWEFQSDQRFHEFHNEFNVTETKVISTQLTVEVGTSTCLQITYKHYIDYNYRLFAKVLCWLAYGMVILPLCTNFPNYLMVDDVMHDDGRSNKEYNFEMATPYS